MNSKTTIVIRVIETYLFGEYFKKLSQGNEMSNVGGSINTKDESLKLPKFESVDECKELLDYLGKERGLIDSKYDFMGNYTINDIDFMYINLNDDITGYYPTINIKYKFENLNWDKINNNNG